MASSLIRLYARGLQCPWSAIALGVLPQTLLLAWMEPSVTGMVENLARLRP